MASSRKKRALRQLNKAASHLPYSLQLLGIHNGLFDLARVTNRVIYERQWTKSLRFQTVKRDRGTRLCLSPAPRLLKGGGVFSLSEGMANRWGSIYTATGELIVSYENVYEFNPVEKLAQHPMLLPRVSQLDEPVAVLAARDYNYFHWMFDVLPKLHLLDRAGYEGIRLFVNVRERVQHETLTLLGVSKARVLDARTCGFVRAGELVVPNYVDPVGACRVLERKQERGSSEVVMGNVHACVGVSEWITRFLRGAFLDAPDDRAATPSRVYVSRADANKARGVRQEDGFVELISRYGFERVVLSRMSFRDQVNLFSHADVVIAPHGAGLANIVFCRPGTKCLELFSPSYVSDLYAVLSAISGVEYYYLVGSGELDRIVRSNDDFDVNARDLEMLFELAGIPRS